MKEYVELKSVVKFMAEQSAEVKAEYGIIVQMLKEQGRLVMPFGEKVNKVLFAIRVINAGNVRVFYVYGKNNFVFALSGYVKTTEQIPQHQLEKAMAIYRQLRMRKLV